MARKGSSSDTSRFVIVALVAALVLGLAFAASKLRGTNDVEADSAPAPSAPPPLPPPSIARSVAVTPLVPPAAVDAGAAVDADDAADASLLDAAREDAFVVDRVLAPWVLEHRTVDRGIGSCGGMESTITPRLRFQSDGGAIVRELAAIDESCPHGVSRTNTVEKTFDFDGDGTPELMIVTETTGPTGPAFEESAIWTMKGSKISPYLPPEAGAVPVFSDVQDVDKDGRPDLLSRLGYTQVGAPPACGVGFVVPPLFLFHSRPGGTFTRTDAVAKKHLDDTCGPTPLAKVLENEGDLGTAVACARAKGQGADAVAHTLTTGCLTFSATACDPTANDAGKRAACPSWALTLAKQSPPPP